MRKNKRARRRPTSAKSGRTRAQIQGSGLMRAGRRYGRFGLHPNHPMPKYVIEREIPQVGKLTPAQLGEISRKSCNVLQQMGPRVQWLHSYVTPDKIFCVYIAVNEEAVREHARQGGFPANRVSEVKTMIDPVTGGA
jgi:hypothetical protein